MEKSRKPNKPDSPSKLVLQEVIGLTTKNANGLASAISSSKCFYLAGCVVVVYDVDRCTQSHLIVSHRLPKPLSCVAVSQNGRFVAAGESGNLSAALVWDSETLAFVSELKGHLYGVECLAFSPDGEYLVTVGGYIYLWDWRRSILITKLKASSSCSAVTSVNFSSDGKFIVTAGNKHLKFWTVGSLPKTRSNKWAGSITINGKPLDLGLRRGSSFIAVMSTTRTNSSSRNTEQAGETSSIYALTDAGTLCIMNASLSVKRTVDLKVEKSFAISASNQLIACACSKGVVQLFILETLEYAGMVLHSGAKGGYGESHNVCPVVGREKEFQLAFAPDAIACQFSTAEKLVVIYGDHSLYVWDVGDVNKPTRCSMLLSHSACLWDIKNLCCGNMHNPSLACAARGCSGGVSFATCSADGTIRLWDLAFQLDSSEFTTDNNSLNAETVGKVHLASAGIFERDLVETRSSLGFRSLAISHDGKYLAAGDCEGNLHIYDLHTLEYACFKNAHDAEILSLSFSLQTVEDVNLKSVLDGHCLLASGGRDGAIHLYDVKRNFDLIGSIDDHSAAVTSVKFPCNGCKILSCSADRFLVFRDVVKTERGLNISVSHRQTASRGTVYDMAIDPTSEVVVTVSQDRRIKVFDIATGKLIRSFKQENDYGDPIKVVVDPSCNYLVCCYSNKTICMFNFTSGEIVAQALGHGDVVTGLIFLPDCKHIVSVGGDGCIFVWKVPSHMSSQMLQTVKENASGLSPQSLVQPVSFRQIMLSIKEDQPKDLSLLGKFEQVEETEHVDGRSSPWTSSFKFSLSRLPKWAQAKVTTSDIVPMHQNYTLTQHKQEQKTSSTLLDDVADYSSVWIEYQTPKHGSISNKSCLSSVSTCSKDTETLAFREEIVSSDMDNHWHTIYNVCLDLLSSPEVQSMKNVKIPFASIHTLHHPAKQQNSVNDMVVLDEWLQSDSNDVEMSKDVKASSHIDHSEIFKLFFGGISTADNVKTEKSSQRRRCSSQYVLRRDYFGDGKQLLDASSRGVDSNRQDKKPSNTLQNADEVASDVESTERPNKEDAQQIRSVEASDETAADPKGNSMKERITTCREALCILDTAADNLLQLFSELGSMSCKENMSSGARAHLYNEAAELLPAITRKVNAVAKITQRNNYNSCTAKVEALESEPFLGTLAES